jgi:translation initiation factor IF-2
MPKIRVHQLAKELGLSSKEAIEKLAQVGVEVKSHSSTVEDDAAGKVRAMLDGGAAPGAPEAAIPLKKKKPAPPAERGPKPSPKPTPAPATAEEPAAAAPAEAVTTDEAVEEPPAAPAAAIHIARGPTVGEFAEKIGRLPTEVIKTLLGLGEMKTITQLLTDEEMELLAGEFDVAIEIVSPEEEQHEPLEPPEEEEGAETRAPVVTVMGHVDHGKSSILQHFRQKEMLALEAGGITQAIGAYQVHDNGRVVTFIDTPGHEAFTQMRARGAQVTDIAVLVVAADDGVQPQTVEALDHARAAGVPVIVAVNKIDRPEADAMRVRQQLAEKGLQPEEWGGDTVYVDVSAKNGTNMDQLLEMIHLVSDLAELKANPNTKARGVAIEAHLDKGRGPVATLLVQKGKLSVGDPVVCGAASCKVRAMIDEIGHHLKEAGPSQAVMVTGWSKVPAAGDEFRVVHDEREAKRIVQEREHRLRQAEQVAAAQPTTLRDLLARTREGEIPQLNVILKSDTQGSLEALVDSLEKLDQTLVRITPLRRGVGAISENDVTLAQASGAIVVGFNVRPDAGARQLAEREGVDIRTYEVIYQLLEDIEQATKGLLAPLEEEFILGAAEILQTFRIPKTVAAGCRVTEGKITASSRARLLRDGAVVHTGEISSLRRFKDEVSEVAAGLECGITLEGYNDFHIGDVIEAFEIREVPRT